MCGIPELAGLNLETSAVLGPPLPSEVTDLVIDQLRKDKTTLIVCSLVCRSWLPRARHNLFSVLNIRTRLTSVQRLLQSPLCTIHPHVRGLKLCIDSSTSAPMARFTQEINAHSTLLLLRMKTTRGAGLTLVDGDLQGTLSTLKNLRYLKLRHVGFGSLESRIRLFASLPELETLVIHGVNSYFNADFHSEGDRDSLMHAVSPPENLRRIFIGDADIPHELRWLTVHCRHPLTTLHLHDINLECLPIVLSYLRQSSQLRCLSLDFCGWETRTDLEFDLLAQIDLTSQRDLRCLRLNSPTVVPLLSELLPQVRSLHIEEITMSTGGYVVDFAWADLREIFMSPAVRDLKRLYVEEEYIDEISEVLPGFASREVMLPLYLGDFRRETAELSLPSALY